MKAKNIMYLLTGGLILLIITTGYLVFRYFVTSIAGTPEAYGLLFFAVVAGVATFFSPCSFPLMPGYLSHLATKTQKGTLYYGLLGASGVVLFNLTLGSVIGIAGEGLAKSFSITSGTPNQPTLTLRALIGVVLILLGLSQYKDLPRNLFHKVGHAFSLKSRNTTGSVFLYGFGYTAAGLGCAGPIMAGLIVFAFASGGFASALVAFIVYSLTMSILMLTVSALVGVIGRKTIRRMQEATPKIKKVAAVVQILVGIFLIYSVYNIELFRRLFP